MDVDVGEPVEEARLAVSVGSTAVYLVMRCPYSAPWNEGQEATDSIYRRSAIMCPEGAWPGGGPVSVKVRL